MNEFIEIIKGRPFFASSLHDYTLNKDGNIEYYGLYEEELDLIKTKIDPSKFDIIEVKRNPDNDFIRINVSLKKEI